MVSSINYALASLPNIYDQNNANLAGTLQQLESGKNFQTPSDDPTDYFRSEDLNEQYNEYSAIKTNLTEWQGVLSTASTAAGEVYNDLTTMQSLSQGYASADAQTQASSTSEYNVLAQNIMSTVGAATYQGKSLLWSQGPLATINLVPDSAQASGQLPINLGQIIGSIGDNTTTYDALYPSQNQTIADVGPAINTALSDAQAFIGGISGYQNAIQSQLNVTNSTMQNLQSFGSTLTNIDTAQVMTTYTQQEILQQAGAAILSQANLDQKNVLQLYQFPSLQL